MFDVAFFAVTGSIIRWIPQVLQLRQPPTVGAVAIVVFLAILAERRSAIAQGIIPPDPFAAAGADHSLRI